MYKHLTLEERHYIKLRLKIDTITDIANSLNRCASTISREIKRNKGLKGYRYKQANAKAMQRHVDKAKAVKIDAGACLLITNCLQMSWSPEQICGWLKAKFDIDLHHETIYRFVLKDKKLSGKLYLHLRRQGKVYRKRYGSGRVGASIANRVDISMRPVCVETRERVGDWEADTIIGKNHRGCIVTIDDRKSKLRLASPLNRKLANDVKDAIISLLEPIKNVVKTITFDNGKEFVSHQLIDIALNCQSYFAKPYHSWERGQNENANGLLRQYFPKSLELIDVSMKSVMIAVDELNSRPRKCLGYQTPYEAFYELTNIDVRPMVVLHL